MDNILDVFKENPFSVVNLTDGINKLAFVPSRTGEMGLFKPSGVTTLSIAIEQKENVLILVPPTPRGGPGTTVEKKRRSMLDIRVPHFEIDDTIMADEVQGVRAFVPGMVGDTSLAAQIETVEEKVYERGADHSQSMEATSEYSRIGAIKGLVTYADGSTLDLFKTFNVQQQAEINFDLDNVNAADGALRKRCAGVIRQMGNELGAVPFTGAWAFCGDNYFDDLLGNKEVRDTFKNWTQAQILRDGYVGPNRSSWGMFEFGGIVWENYRGTVNGTDYVNTDKCHLFPIGAPGVFRTYWAPADYNETVNTIGRRLYAKLIPMRNDKGVEYEVQMNELNICTRPRTLIQGKRT
jgi:Phage major capsid protein E